MRTHITLSIDYSHVQIEAVEPSRDGNINYSLGLHLQVKNCYENILFLAATYRTYEHFVILANLSCGSESLLWPLCPSQAKPTSTSKVDVVFYTEYICVLYISVYLIGPGSGPTNRPTESACPAPHVGLSPGFTIFLQKKLQIFISTSIPNSHTLFTSRPVYYRKHGQRKILPLHPLLSQCAIFPLLLSVIDAGGLTIIYREPRPT